MDILIAERYIEERSVINLAGANHQPTIDLTQGETLESDINRHVRFERLWDWGKSLLEVEDNRGGVVEGRGYTESGIPLSVTLTFRIDDIKPKLASGMVVCFNSRRVIEAQWSDNGQPLVPLEIIRETETELDTKSNDIISPNAVHNLLLVEESIAACQYLRAQRGSIEQPEPILFEAA